MGAACVGAASPADRLVLAAVLGREGGAVGSEDLGIDDAGRRVRPLIQAGPRLPDEISRDIRALGSAGVPDSWIYYRMTSWP